MQWTVGGVALALLVGFAPTSQAGFTCDGVLLTNHCSGVDDAPDCPGRTDTSRWGIYVLTFPATVLAFGGTESCAQNRSGSWHNRTLDLYASGQGTRIDANWHHSERLDANGYGTTCSLRAEVRMDRSLASPVAPCAHRPPNPSDPVP